jgi:pSer/pThr/pTyr-binding forkhead associated (FHA) protein
MDELIYVEVLGRHGEVAARHALRGLPIRIGRAYDGDVVLDDPCVAAHHAVVARSEAGDLEIADAGSRNGLFRLGAKRRLARERVDPGARYRVGRTVFRIRTANHPVAPELVERAAARWDRAIAWVAVLAATAAVLLCVWSETHERVEWLKLLAAPVFVLLAILGWSGAWGLAGRLLVGEARFAGHLAMGALTVLGCLAVANWDYLAFAFSAPGLRYVVAPATAAVVAWGLWRHLSLATRRPAEAARWPQSRSAPSPPRRRRSSRRFSRAIRSSSTRPTSRRSRRPPSASRAGARRESSFERQGGLRSSSRP